MQCSMLKDPISHEQLYVMSQVNHMTEQTGRACAPTAQQLPPTCTCTVLKESDAACQLHLSTESHCVCPRTPRTLLLPCLTRVCLGLRTAVQFDITDVVLAERRVEQLQKQQLSLLKEMLPQQVTTPYAPCSSPTTGVKAVLGSAC